ncbi:NAD(P)-dependent oxidoreductase [Enterobacterales bacterium 8AC]|nr:NAD(P)-dependent oxidoreductase [Enterobacterales bacterium 8AC]
MRLLITGAGSDLAQYVNSKISQDFDIELATKDKLDVTSIVSVREYFNAKKFDIVLNCAGTLYESNVVDSEPEKWINDISVNLIGAYLVAREALIRNSNCIIINISSTAAFHSYSNWTSYCAAKSGVLKLSSGLFKDGYRVITLCPGAIETKIRNYTKVINPNIMTLEEGCKPIIDSLYGGYKFGDVVFYRKNELIVNPDCEWLS